MENSPYKNSSQEKTYDGQNSEETICQEGVSSLETIDADKVKTNARNETRVQQRSSVLSSGEMFAHYRIEEELGRGGMGVVYKVTDTQLNRTVALKVIIGQDITEQGSKRFLQEAKATAQLEHPNIIKLYSVGDTPQNYFTMEYIAGENLSDLSRKHAIKYQEAAILLEKIATAAHFAHEKGIIHRDIKPSNVMVDKKQQPRLMDFGLAKLTDVHSSVSKSGNMVGTPAYMPPEQAEGEKIDPRADVYSLGATLYDLLTGRPPFQGESYYNILHQIYCVEPISPRKLDPDIPGELEAICLKALEKKKDNRYNSALVFATDLQNYLQQRPILAKPPTKITYLKKFIIRNRTVVLTSFIVLLSIIIGGIVSFMGWQRAEEEKENTKNALKLTKKAQEKAEEEKENTKNALKLTKKAQEKAEKEQKKAQTAENLAKKSRNQANLRLARVALAKSKETYHNKEWQKSGVLAGEALQFIIDQFSKEAKNLRQQAMACIRLALLQERLLWEIDLPKSYPVEVFKQKNNKIVILLEDGEIQIRDSISGKYISSVFCKPAGKIIKAAFHHLTNTLAMVVIDKKITIEQWDLTTSKRLHTLSGPNDLLYELYFTKNGKTLIASSEDGFIYKWDAEKGQQIHKIKMWIPFSGTKGEYVKRSITSTLRENSLLVASEQKIQLYSQEKSQIVPHKGQEKGPNGPAGRNYSDYNTFLAPTANFNSDGSNIATICQDKMLRLWEIQNDFGSPSYSQLVETKTGFSDAKQLLFDPQGQKLAVVGSTNIQIWTIADPVKDKIRDSFLREQQVAYGSEEKTKKKRLISFCKITSRDKNNFAKAYFANNNTLITVSNNKIRSWNISWGQEAYKPFATKYGSYYKIKLSQHNNAIIAFTDNHIDLRHLDKKPLEIQLPQFVSILTVEVSPITNEAIVIYKNGQVKRYDSQGKEIGLWQIQYPYSFLSFSKCGKYLAAITNQHAKIWDIQNGKEAMTITKKQICDLQFSDDGNFILVNDTKEAEVWSLEKHKKLDINANSIVYKKLNFYDKSVFIINIFAKIITSVSHRNQICVNNNVSLVAVKTEKNIELWDIKSNRKLAQFISDDLKIKTKPTHEKTVRNSTGLQPLNFNSKTIENKAGLSTMSFTTKNKITILNNYEIRSLYTPDVEYIKRDSIIPTNIEEMVDKAISQPSLFYIRKDLVPGWCIEKLLIKHPRRTAISLFALQVTDILTTKLAAPSLKLQNNFIK